MTGLTNAVMRKIVTEGPALTSRSKMLRVINCPDWLWQSWAASYGPDVAASPDRPRRPSRGTTHRFLAEGSDGH